MVQIVKISDEKRVPLPVPEWLSKPVSGEEARQRAKKYEDRMQKVAAGRETDENGQHR